MDVRYTMDHFRSSSPLVWPTGRDEEEQPQVKEHHVEGEGVGGGEGEPDLEGG